jgi:hypothetical protein
MYIHDINFLEIGKDKEQLLTKLSMQLNMLPIHTIKYSKVKQSTTNS